MEHVLTMANLKLKPSLFTPRPTVHVGLYRAYVACSQLRVQDVVSGGGSHFHFWATGGIQGPILGPLVGSRVNAPGGALGGGAPGSSWVSVPWPQF